MKKTTGGYSCVERTKASIKEAFLELMKTKSYARISVREITEKAQINRSTFYAHYMDTYDLLDNIEREIISEIHDRLMDISDVNYIPGKHPLHVKLFTTMCSYTDVCRILMGDNGDIQFTKKLQQTFLDAFNIAWDRNFEGCSPAIAEMCIRYVSHAIVGLFEDYIENDFEWTPEEMGFFAGEITNWIDENFVKHHPNG